MLAAGDTFLGSPDKGKPHLWIVLTDPDERNFAACVAITTRAVVCDDTTVCDRRDHQFITSESVIAYADADLFDMARVDEALKAGNAKKGGFDQRPRCNKGLWKKVQQGLLKSRFTRRKIKDYCAAAWQANL